MPDFEGRGVHRRVTGTFLDDHAVLHDLGGYPAGILAFEGDSSDDGGTENGPFGKADGRRSNEFLVGLNDFDLLHLRECDRVLYRHRVTRVGIAYGNPTA